MKIYAGNLAVRMSDGQLREVFEEYGQVATCEIARDKVSGQSKSFAFLEMPERENAMEAIAGLNGREVMGRKINVTESRPRVSSEEP